MGKWHRRSPESRTASRAEEYREELFGREIVRFRYASVALARLRGREYVERGTLGAALAALMKRRRHPVELGLLARMLQRVLTSGLDEGLKFLLVTVIKTYFRVPESERERWQRLLSRKEYKVVQDTELTWADELILKGREEGREEGRVQGKRETLKRLFTAKFGPLSAVTEARIDAMAAPELDSHLEHVLTAASLDEMGIPR